MPVEVEQEAVPEEVTQVPIKPERPKRIPVSGNRDILVIPNMDPNYMYRWVSDKDNGQRLQKFLEGGYEFVKNDGQGDNKLSVSDYKSVGSVLTRYAGGGVTLVAMRIPREWYDEDQAAKQAEIDAVEDSMFQQHKVAGHYGELSQSATKSRSK